MKEFDLIKVKVINRLSSFLEKGPTRQTASIDVSRVKIVPAILAAPSKVEKKERKKGL